MNKKKNVVYMQRDTALKGANENVGEGQFGDFMDREVRIQSKDGENFRMLLEGETKDMLVGMLVNGADSFIYEVRTVAQSISGIENISFANDSKMHNTHYYESRIDDYKHYVNMEPAQKKREIGNLKEVITRIKAAEARLSEREKAKSEAGQGLETEATTEAENETKLGKVDYEKLWNGLKQRIDERIAKYDEQGWTQVEKMYHNLKNTMEHAESTNKVVVGENGLY